MQQVHQGLYPHTCNNENNRVSSCDMQLALYLKNSANSSFAVVMNVFNAIFLCLCTNTRICIKKISYALNHNQGIHCFPLLTKLTGDTFTKISKSYKTHPATKINVSMFLHQCITNVVNNKRVIPGAKDAHTLLLTVPSPHLHC